MIRISIDWDFISPSMQVMSGIMTIENVPSIQPQETILKCKIKKEASSFSFDSLDDNGISCALFAAFEEKIHTMVNGYFQGMLLRKDQFDWVEDSSDIEYDDWLEQKGIEKIQRGDEVIYNKVESQHLKNWNVKRVKKYDKLQKNKGK